MSALSIVTLCAVLPHFRVFSISHAFTHNEVVLIQVSMSTRTLTYAVQTDCGDIHGHCMYAPPKEKSFSPFVNFLLSLSFSFPQQPYCQAPSPLNHFLEKQLKVWLV